MQPNRNLLMDSFVAYMKRNHLSDQSIKGYRCIVEKFLSETPDGYKATYNEILNYLDSLNSYGLTKATKQGKLTALKKFFDFLVETGQRDDHPCKMVYLKVNAKRNVIQADLFTMHELESLLEREERFPHLKLKNQVVISFLIYQGLLPGEIVNLKLHHVDLDLGSVYVNSGRTLTARRLPLMDSQMELIDTYKHLHRPRLMLREKHEFLITNYHGLPEKVDGINYLIETYKSRFPERNINCKAIRDSVISYWMNTKKMSPEQVQLLAGHRWISSTLRYKIAPVKQEREILNRFFPI